MEPPTVTVAEQSRRRLGKAEGEIRSAGLAPTIDRIAEELGITPRQVRRLKASADVRATP